MEVKRAPEVKVPTCTGEEPIWIVALGVWGRQLDSEVHVPAPKSVVGVQAWQIIVFVIGGPQFWVIAIVLVARLVYAQLESGRTPVARRGSVLVTVPEVQMHPC